MTSRPVLEAARGIAGDRSGHQIPLYRRRAQKIKITTFIQQHSLDNVTLLPV